MLKIAENKEYFPGSQAAGEEVCRGLICVLESEPVGLEVDLGKVYFTQGWKKEDRGEEGYELDEVKVRRSIIPGWRRGNEGRCFRPKRSFMRSNTFLPKGDGWGYYLQQKGYVCLSVSRIMEKLLEPFPLHLVTWCNRSQEE